MKGSTIAHIVERIDHANTTHGVFTSPIHAITQARIELMEAEVAATHLCQNEEVVLELLDTAVVCIRAAEQFGGLSND